MTSIGAGRPRSSTRKRPGATARDEILDAAAELFTTQGYTSTSTRVIADAVGIRQASLYHHFATKDDILAALLVGTVDAPLEHAHALRGRNDDAVARIYALARFDAEQLADSRWNLGALYLQPELATDRFEPFRIQRMDLMAVYTEFSVAAIAAIGELDPTDIAIAALPFRLVESIINTRSESDAVSDGWATTIADAAARTLGWRGPTGDLADRAQRMSASVSR